MSISSSHETGQNEKITGRGCSGGVPGFHRRLGLLLVHGIILVIQVQSHAHARGEKTGGSFSGIPRRSKRYTHNASVTVESTSSLTGHRKDVHLREGQASMTANWPCPTKNLFLSGRLPVEVARWCHTRRPKNSLRNGCSGRRISLIQQSEATLEGRLFQGAEPAQSTNQSYPARVPVVALTIRQRMQQQKVFRIVLLHSRAATKLNEDHIRPPPLFTIAEHMSL